MGKSSYIMKNRMKALSESRKNAPKKTEEQLDKESQIKECEYKIRQCLADMDKMGENQMIRGKIRSYEEKIERLKL